MTSVDVPEQVSSDYIPFADKAKHSPDVPALNPDLYSLSPDEAAFFKTAIGIDDDDELKAHILSVQEKAWKVAPWGCIYVFGFLRISIVHRPEYQEIIKIGRERQNAILLDIGCCLATESRRVAADGFPAHNIVASDLKQGYLDLSHVLFRTSKETYPGHFIAGDVFDPEMLTIAPPARGPVPEPLPDLSRLMTLNSLRGHCSVINASAFFSCFSEEQQLHVARGLAGLLSPVPGSLITGIQPGATVKGTRPHSCLGVGYDIFCHSPESWTELWDGTVFAKGEVKVIARLKEASFLGNVIQVLEWCVTRL
ncbi:hypothetical protein BKA82DRAFT_4153012 [Pisolithus tinctorius]|nr:hypothetical protein BKA82DRAFT_4153012 [Pisolithus tinctorius]